MKGMNNGKCISRVLVMAGAMLLIGLHMALAIPKRPEPARLVNDLAGLFSSEQTRHLEDMLVAFDDSTTNQIAV
ncbi:TPM domain-containing protein, partial [Klebsiella pneumoniae]|uniref:TPM domain-containing protein n=1 Tax=Klebsiella pneumoniae TaxID=573 RepID=UPI0025A094D8